MVIKILLLVILIIINGIFSATEIAFLSLNKYELNKELKKGNKKATKILNLINDSSTFLSAIQIAITLSGFLASAFAAESFASEIANMLNVTIVSEATLTTILIVVITMILSYFTLVFGELVPKKIGLAHCKQISFAMVDIIYLVIQIFKPFIIILRSSVNLIIKLLNIKEVKEIDEDNVKSTIIDSELEEFEKDLLFNVFEFNDTTVKEAMTPKKDIVSIDVNANQEDILKVLRKYKYTRLPVTENNEIIGMLNVKDLMIKNKKDFHLRKYLRKLDKIKSNMIIDDAFLYLSSKKAVMAKVVENNEIIGIITIEDIVEEVVGSIVDEYN